MNQKLAHAVIAASLSLAGCGGGGGNTSAAPVTPPAPVTPAPQPPVLVVQPASIQGAVAPSYTASSKEIAAFNAFAAFRSAMGLGPVNQSSSIDTAAANHAEYVGLNGGDTHTEVAGKPGFTGAQVKDRLIAAGYGATDAGEVMGWRGTADSSAEAIENLLGTVYHRALMMSEHWTDMGIASSSNGSVLIDFGSSASFTQRAAGDFVGVYPADNQANVALNHSPEWPNPFPDIDGSNGAFCTKTSYPISIMSQASTKLTVTTFTVTELGAAAAEPARLLTTDTDATNLLRQNMAFLVGKAAFKPNTTYVVRFVGSATGSATGAKDGVMAIDKIWRFVTKPAREYYCSTQT